MIQPLSLSEFLALAKSSKRVAVFEAIKMGSLSPIDAYMACKGQLNGGAILEKTDDAGTPSYSYLLFDPFAKVTTNRDAIITTIDKEAITSKGCPFEELRSVQKRLSFSTRSDVVNLISSAMGFVSYDAVRYIESIPNRHEAESSFPDILFEFYRVSITFDHLHQKILISVMVDIDDDEPQKKYRDAQAYIYHLIEMLKKTVILSQPIQEADNQPCLIKNDISDDEFMHMVRKAKEYIIRGEIFQIVISRCFKINYSLAPISIYKALRRISPTPYMFFFEAESEVVMGASPERLIKVQQNKITVNPIAGTRKRSTDKDDDAIACDLLTDEKEVAEHMMLVDLARNDVGAVAVPGSVAVDELLMVKHYSHVSHICSVVSGQLNDKLDCIDAFIAAFPAGTVSGAPKIRAMEIIDELETSRRGIYGGAICRFDYKANLDSCIAIRMAHLKDGIATIRAGAGIVYDSDPQMEAQETLKKASAMCAAIKAAHGEYV